MRAALDLARGVWRELNRPVRLGRDRAAAPAGRRGERGIALIMVMIVLTILISVLAEFSMNTRLNYGVATNLRDDLKAYYLARSGMNLGRVIMHFSSDLNAALSSIPGLPPIPLSLLSGVLMEPFNSGSVGGSLGIDLSGVTTTEGLGDLDGMFTVSPEEECGINLMPNAARREATVRTLESLLADPKYNPLFEEMGPDGVAVSRDEVVSALVDFADRDTELTDPLNMTAGAASTGGESDPYQLLSDPYVRKDYPYCSRDEANLAHGVGDDLFTTLGPAITVFPTEGGAGKVNINCASPPLVRALLCEAIGDPADYETYCRGPDQTVMNTCTVAFLQAMQFLRINNATDAISMWNGLLEICSGPIINKAKLEAVATFTSSIYTMYSEANVGKALSRITVTLDTSRTDASGRARGAILYYRED